jgi:hypothetical protein
MIGDYDGGVKKIARMGEAAYPTQYHKLLKIENILQDTSMINNLNHPSTTSNHLSPMKIVEFSSRVTSVAIRTLTPKAINSRQEGENKRGASATTEDSKHTNDNSMAVKEAIEEDNDDYYLAEAWILVGRADGSLDLFSSNEEYPLISWSLDTMLESRNNKSGGQAILHISWLEFSVSSFLVIDSRGSLYHFDLLMDLYKPFRTESLGLPFPCLEEKLIVITKQRSHVDKMYVIAGNDSQQVQEKQSKKVTTVVRTLHVDDMVAPHRPSAADEAHLKQVIYHSISSDQAMKKLIFSSSTDIMGSGEK